MNKDQAIKLIQTYGKAWETQDTDLVCSIFTEDATYHDPKEKKAAGISEIRDYWNKKVKAEQKDIHFSLLNVWVDGDTVIAEWKAQFIDMPRNLRVELFEVAVLTVVEDKFSSLREYYKSEKTPV